MDQFNIRLATPPTAANSSYDYELRRSLGTTGVGCTVLAADRTCSDTAKRQCYKVGDGIVIKVVSGVTADTLVAVGMTWMARFTPGPCTP